MTAQLIGQRELANTFRRIADETDKKEMENRLMKVGRGLAKKIRGNAPKGPTGNLKKAIETKRYRKKVKQSPAIFVRVNERKAPHAHLIARGTKGLRYPTERASAKVKEEGGWFVFLNGNPVWVTHTGQMPANPFFQRTVDENEVSVLQEIQKETVQLIEKTGKKLL